MSAEAVERQNDGSMTLLEHLTELRRRLFIAAGALVITTCLSFYPLTGWALEWLKEPADKHGEGFELIFTAPTEFWTVYFQVSLLLGFALAMPIILWQFMAFIGPGLTRAEKRWAYPIVLSASFMFVLGCAFAYYVEMPPALSFLFDAPNDIARPLINVRSYVTFATRLMLVTGLAFETPFVIGGLAWLGVVTSKQLLRYWRFAIVGAFIISAIVTPSIDPVTQTLVAGPMVVLYFVGILFARLVEKNPIIPRVPPPA